MRTLASAMLLLVAAGCHAPFRHGRESYHDGMRALQYNPTLAREEFLVAETDMAEVLSDPELPTGRRVTASSIRVRALIELERHDEARTAAGQAIPGFDAQAFYEGDAVGLSLLKARALDPERGYAELLLGERLATTLPSRLHLAREQVHALRTIGTPQAKAEAAKICQAHAGKLDFDQLKP